MRFLILSPLTFPWVCFAQHLDHVQTKKQAEMFIVRNLKYNDLKYDGFSIAPADSSGIDVFKKGDFNRDGKSDLFIFGTAQITEFGEPHDQDEMLIILGDEKAPKKVEFSFKFFSNGVTAANPYPKVIRKSGKDYIAIRYELLDRRDRVVGRTADTIFVEDDRFMLYTSKPDQQEIQSLEYKTTPCYAKCPVFEFSINEAGEVKYKGIDHVSKKGDFALTADPKDWIYMRDMIKNCRARELKEKYATTTTDEQTGTLTVHYKNGETKRIEDYGLVGTFGLSILFDFFQDMIKF